MTPPLILFVCLMMSLSPTLGETAHPKALTQQNIPLPPDSEDNPLSRTPQNPPQTVHLSPQNFEAPLMNTLALRLDPFKVLILDAKGPVGLLGLEVTLEAYTLEKAAVIKAVWPKIRSYILEDLYAVAPFFLKGGYRPTRHALRTRLKHLCDTFFGPDVVEGVVLQKAYLRTVRPPQKTAGSRPRPLDKPS